MHLHITFFPQDHSEKELYYCLKESPLGRLLFVGKGEEIFALGFAQGDYPAFLERIGRIWGAEALTENPNGVLADTNAVLFRQNSHRIVLKATVFERKVWTALAKVQSPVSYGSLASLAGCPTAVRAAATAVGHNPVSLLLPCHRIIRSNGATGRYLWGTNLKSALLNWEKQNSIWQIPTTISVE